MNILFEGLTVPDNAKLAQNAVISRLQSLGYKCVSEYPVEDNGNNNPGRIDVVAINGDEKLAIEIDRHSPRKKSVHKLKLMSEYKKLILLRGYGNGEVDGIQIMVIPTH